MTKSLKDRDYCVAGIDLQSGAWVRLVSSNEGGAFQKELLDDINVNVLDVIEVELKRYTPYEIQVENWIIDETKQILKTGTKTLQEIISLRGINKSQFIFVNNKNELTKDDVNKLKHSIEMVEVQDLSFDTCLKGDGRNHYKISFTYKKEKYHLALTDPKFRIANLDSWNMPKAIIIVSIPPVPYGENELYYKFVAKVFF